MVLQRQGAPVYQNRGNAFVQYPRMHLHMCVCMYRMPQQSRCSRRGPAHTFACTPARHTRVSTGASCGIGACCVARRSGRRRRTDCCSRAYRTCRDTRGARSRVLPTSRGGSRRASPAKGCACACTPPPSTCGCRGAAGRICAWSARRAGDRRGPSGCRESGRCWRMGCRSPARRKTMDTCRAHHSEIGFRVKRLV